MDIANERNLTFLHCFDFNFDFLTLSFRDRAKILYYTKINVFMSRFSYFWTLCYTLENKKPHFLPFIKFGKFSSPTYYH